MDPSQKLEIVINRPSAKTPAFQVTAAGIVMSISVLGDSLLYSVLPSRLGEFGLAAGIGAGLLLSINRWVRLASNAWAASLIKRFGLKKPFFFSLPLAATTTMTYGLFPRFWPMLIARIGWGFCFSIQLVTMYMVILQQEPFHRGKYMGLYNSLLRSGSLIAVLFGGILADMIGIQTTFLFFAALTLLNFPLVNLIQDRGPSTFEEKGVITINEQNLHLTISSRSKRLWGFLLGTSEIIHNNRVRLLSLNYLRFTNSFTVSGLIVATLGFLVQERFGASTGFLGLTFGATTLTGIILGTSWGSEVSLSLYFGKIADKVSPKKVLRFCIPTVTAGTLLIILDNPFPMVLGIPVVFIAATATKVALDSAVGDIASIAHREKVMGRYATWTDFGAALGPLVGYGMIQLTGSSLVYFGAGFLMLSGLVAYSLTERYLMR